MDQGFSLTEVLVSLVLMTSTSLVLLKQQWQVSQLYNQVVTRAGALSQLDNVVERLHIGLNSVSVGAPFKLRYSRTTQTIKTLLPSTNDQRLQVLNVQIAWTPQSTSSRTCCAMDRLLVIELSDD